jgi:uncharacterized protein (TIGR02453 family)
MAKGSIQKESIDFLKKLKKNNNRDWFNKHKEEYLAHRENIIGFADTLLDELNKHDKIETDSGKKSLFRIYKDVRFSKDKTPYNSHWSGSFKRATKQLRGGYYFNINPVKSRLSGGFWGPNPDDLKRIRQDIDLNYKEWRKILNNKTFVNTFGSLRGEQVSSAPRGYSKDHPAIDLLRYKQFIITHEFTDKEVLSPDFAKKMSEVYKKMRPFLNHMSEVLTTNANGEPII